LGVPNHQQRTGVSADDHGFIKPVRTEPAPKRLNLGSVQKLANQLSFFFILNAREEFLSQSHNRFRLVEGHLVIYLPTLKMAGLAFSLEDWLDV